MANYINQNILCQAYIHIDPVPLDKEEYERFKQALQEYIQTRGKFFLYDEVDTEIELKDGSLKVYGTILGFVYMAISQYGDFRTGVDYLEKDIRRLSEVIISESLFQSKSRYNNVVRVEARVGIIGSIKSIVDRIDAIKASSGKANPEDIAYRLTALSTKIDQLLENLTSDKDIEYMKKNLLEELNAIPQTPIPRPDEQVLDTTKILYREERKKLLKTCA